jgi:hypothetical protein
MYRVPQNTYQYFLAIPKRKFTKNGGCSVLSLHQSKGFKEFYLRFWQAADLEYLVLYVIWKQMLGIPNSKNQLYI